MKNKELQDLLKKYPDEKEVAFLLSTISEKFKIERILNGKVFIELTHDPLAIICRNCDGSWTDYYGNGYACDQCNYGYQRIQ